MAVKTEKGSEVKDFNNDPIDNDKVLGYNQADGTRWWSLSRFWNWLWSKIKSNTKSTLDTSDPTAPVNTSAVNGALANYPLINQRGNSNTSFSSNKTFGLSYTETQYSSEQENTWIPFLNINYEKDNKWQNIGFFKNRLTIANDKDQGCAVLQDILINYKLKKKNITGITNVNGLLFNENSDISGNEFVVYAYVENFNDYYINIGHSGAGTWLQVRNYDGTIIRDTAIQCFILYFENIEE